MHLLAKFGGVNVHFIHTFKPKRMRPHYPMESDYVATCAID